MTPTLIAERTGLKLSSVSDAVRKLASQGLVDHAPYGAVELTETGRSYALVMVRRHRLIEAFLVSVLGYSWDQVHDEAEHLEHAVSDFMIDRIDEFLEFPTRDPHGDPIPSADGTVHIPDATQLTTVGAGHPCSGRMHLGLGPRAPDSSFRSKDLWSERHSISAKGPAFSDSLDVRVAEAASSVALGRSATDALYVSIADG